MPVLYLSAPREKVTASALHKTFNNILASSTGPDYAIAKKWVAQDHL